MQEPFSLSKEELTRHIAILTTNLADERSGKAFKARVLDKIQKNMADFDWKAYYGIR